MLELTMRVLLFFLLGNFLSSYCPNTNLSDLTQYFVSTEAIVEDFKLDLLRDTAILSHQESGDIDIELQPVVYDESSYSLSKFLGRKRGYAFIEKKSKPVQAGISISNARRHVSSEKDPPSATIIVNMQTSGDVGAVAAKDDMNDASAFDVLPIVMSIVTVSNIQTIEDLSRKTSRACILEAWLETATNSALEIKKANDEKQQIMIMQEEEKSWRKKRSYIIAGCVILATLAFCLYFIICPVNNPSPSS